MAEFEQTSDGVQVRIRSKRGTGTRDEDTVTVTATYEDVATAEAESHRLNQLVRDRLTDARTVSNPPEAENTARSTSNAPTDGSAGTAGTLDNSTDTASTADGSTGTPDSSADTADDSTGTADSSADSGDDSTGTTDTASEPQYFDSASGGGVETVDDSSGHSGEESKVYLGQGSRLSGWIPVPRSVVMEQIAPLVSRNRVSEDEPHVRVNFTSNIPLSGWNTVGRRTVREEIEPIVETTRMDRETATPDRDEGDRQLPCPADGCSYEGNPRGVIDHLTDTDDRTHQQLPVVTCPVDGCSYTGLLDAVGSHFDSKEDGDHDVSLLASVLAPAGHS